MAFSSESLQLSVKPGPFRGPYGHKSNFAVKHSAFGGYTKVPSLLGAAVIAEGGVEAAGRATIAPGGGWGHYWISLLIPHPLKI